MFLSALGDEIVQYIFKFVVMVIVCVLGIKVGSILRANKDAKLAAEGVSEEELAARENAKIAEEVAAKIEDEE